MPGPSRGSFMIRLSDQQLAQVMELSASARSLAAIAISRSGGSPSRQSNHPYGSVHSAAVSALREVINSGHRRTG
jgi:hypothetical protein